MSESKAGNIEAIRDWSRRYFYTKEDISRIFIDGSTDTNKSDLSSFVNVQFREGRYLKTVSDSTGVSSFIFKPQKNGADITDPFSNTPNNFKISVRFKVIFKKNSGNQNFLADASAFENLPSIVYFNDNGASNVAVSWRYAGETSENLLSCTNVNLTVGNTYRVDVECKNSTMSIKLYDGGDSLIDSNQISMPKSIKYSTANSYCFGNGESISAWGFAPGIEFDLFNTYWIANDVLVWGNDYMKHEGA